MLQVACEVLCLRFLDEWYTKVDSAQIKTLLQIIIQHGDSKKFQVKHWKTNLVILVDLISDFYMNQAKILLDHIFVCDSIFYSSKMKSGYFTTV